MSNPIFVIYPFTSQAIGVDDDYVINSNSSNAFFIALRRIQKDDSIKVRAIYLTRRKASYEIDRQGVLFRFLPVTINRGKGHSSFGRQWSLSLIWELVKERPVLVFLFIGGGWFAIFLAMICRLLSIPYCPIMAGRGVSIRRSQKWYYGNALRVVVHTEAHKTLFQRLGINTNNFIVMPMGVDTELFQKLSVANAVQTNDLHFIFVARIVRGKNLLGALQIFVKLVEHYPDSKFDIIGPIADKQYFNEIQQFVSENNLKTNTIFHGDVSNHLLPGLYANSTVMIFPTLSESFGFVIVESMACGVPVAALKGKGGPDEIIEDNLDGILAADENELAKKVLELLASPERLKAMGQAARDKVERLYSVNRTHIQLVELLKEKDLSR